MAQKSLTGERILGYKVEEKLGNGAFGTVYKVTKSNASGTYIRALKHITIPTEKHYSSVLNSMGGDTLKADSYFSEMLNHIVSEIRILNNLSEKGAAHIVRYYENDIRVTESPLQYNVFILMEYLTPLEEYIKSHDNFSVRDVVKLGLDILDGLGFCHNNRIIHRDIKDDNIFVSDTGEYKIGDFGVSKILEDSSRANSLKGTPNFLAPEVYLGKENYTKSVDLYSLGVVLYRLLNYNRNPFLPHFPEQYFSNDEDRAFERRMSGEVPDLPSLGGEGIGNVILKAISSSKDRFQTAEEFSDALKEAAGHTPEKALGESIKFSAFLRTTNRTDEESGKYNVTFNEWDGEDAPFWGSVDAPAKNRGGSINKHLFESIGEAPAADNSEKQSAVDADRKQEEASVDEEKSSNTETDREENLDQSVSDPEISLESLEEESEEPKQEEISDKEGQEQTLKGSGPVEETEEAKPKKKKGKWIAVGCAAVLAIAAGAVLYINMWHTWDSGKILEEADCGKEGCIEYTCTICGKTKQEILPTVEHKFTEYVYNEDATCQKDGTKTAECEYGCGTTDTVTAEGTKDENKHKFTEYVYNEDATCQKDGTKTAECEYGCGTTDTVTAEGTKDQNKHKFTEYVYNEDATCQKDGTKTAECEYGCGTTDTITAEGTKDKHKFTEYVYNEDATCQKDGTKTAECEYGCGATDTKILFSYIIKEDTITITGWDEWKEGESVAIIPDVIKGKKVARIGYRAFFDCNSLIEITISKSVTSIGDDAFRNCDNLTEITIPEGVTSIGNDAFWGCESLTEITLPESVISIGASAFWGCGSLTEITIPKSVTSIGGNTFRCCDNLEKVIVEPGSYAEEYANKNQLPVSYK